MSNIIMFQYDSCEDIDYDQSEGHYYLPAPAFYSAESHANELIDFMLDTGAFLTIITPQTAERSATTNSPINPDIPLSGYTGEFRATLLEIPGLVIGGKILEGAKVAVPKISKHDKRADMNILGLNILEHFNYLIDSTDRKIYFARNEDYKIPKELKCVNIRSISNNPLSPHCYH